MITTVKRLVRPLYRRFFPRSNARVFERIYRERQWGIGDDATAEFYSGIGSYDPSVDEYVELVKRMAKELVIRSVVEIGCGDFAVARKYVDAFDTYVGIDVVRRLVEHNQQRYGNQKVTFSHADASKSRLPASDLCIIRQVLQHLSNRDIEAIFANISSRYVLVTEHLPPPQKIKAYNLDKEADAGIRVPRGSGVFIDRPPFNLKARIVMETCVTSDIHEPDERLVTSLVDLSTPQSPQRL